MLHVRFCRNRGLFFRYRSYEVRFFRGLLVQQCFSRKDTAGLRTGSDPGLQTRDRMNPDGKRQRGCSTAMNKRITKTQPA
jgi:hypothetical protein